METIEGVYRNGRVELTKKPRHADNTKVVVTFPDLQAADTSATPPPSVSQPLPPGPARDAAVEALLAEMDVGIDFGGAPYPTRQEIYDERADELERRRRQTP